jgi:hypothetical protein
VPRSATSERPNTNQVRRAPTASDPIPKTTTRPEYRRRESRLVSRGVGAGEGSEAFSVFVS